MKKLALFLAALIGLSASAQTDVKFSYAQSDQPTSFWGTDKKEIYNVCIALRNPALVGAKIKAINVPVRPSSEVGSVEAWLTTELKIQLVDGKNVNVPNIGSYSVTMPAECDPGLDYAIATVTLPEAVEIPAGGLFVGYTISLDAALATETCRPIVVTKGAAEDGLFVYSSRSYRTWTEFATRLNAVSNLSVDLNMVVPEVGVGISSVENVSVPTGRRSSTTMRVSNVGSSAVTSMNYTVDIEGEVFNGVIDLSASPIPAVLGSSTTVTINTPAVSNDGPHTAVVTIDKVNGMDNEVTTKMSSFTVNAMPFVPVYRPLVEEYTGTGCGWCPRGFAAMEYMAEQYPEDFMGVAWHTYNDGDPMYTTCSPNQASSFPSMYINRSTSLDPYYGTSNSEFHIDKDWENIKASTVTPVGVDVSAWLSEDENTVNARAKVAWAAVPEEGEYRVEFILVANGLTSDDKSWGQSNSYNSSTYAEMFLVGDMFVGKGSTVKGLTYNDVGIDDSGVGGIPNSLSRDILLNAPEIVDYEFDITSLRAKLPLDLTKLRVIAVVLKTKGVIGLPINCNRANVDDWASIESVDVDAAPVSTAYFDIAGRQIQGQPQGLVIRVDRLSDGSLRTTKQLIK